MDAGDNMCSLRKKIYAGERVPYTEKAIKEKEDSKNGRVPILPIFFFGFFLSN